MAHATTRAFADERRSAIMEMLEHNASVQVADIAQTFGVSSVTARADLDALAEAGKLRRTHGGAVSLHKRLTVSTQDRRINVNVAAKQAIAQYRLGEDKIPDLLNVCLDSPRRISEAYGPESIEVEDMYYRLDRDLADFLTFVFAQVRDGNATVVLTSDHGTSPSYDATTEEPDRFNARQFEVIVNGFLNVRYGMGDWVLEYEDKCVYLNHNLIYERGLDLAEVQNEVAIFAMQFSGISHALAATAMRTSYFGSGYARRMQNSFYPRRSGDVILNLMPGWIEEQERCWSMSGSMYGYDTEVPLVFYGTGAGQQHVQRRVDMTSVAPTLARLAGIREPAASEGGVLEEIAE